MRVTGKVDGMSVIAPAAPAAQRQPTVLATPGMLVVVGVQPRQGREVRDTARVRVLLPVEPPEIYSVFFGDCSGETGLL